MDGAQAMSANNDRNTSFVQHQIDWADLKYALLVGAAMVSVKLIGVGAPAWHIRGQTTGIIASILTVVYITARSRRQPEKLDDWGLTTPLTCPILLWGLVLLSVSVGLLAAGGIIVAGSLVFKAFYLTQMVEYIPAAFPQQFFMCSVGLATLATLRPFSGTWRLPLLVGLLFSLAHFWTPARIPGTIVPIQMLLTFPAGFFAAFYFLRFRNILPLTAIHAIAYPLLHNWIESHL